MLVSVLRSRVAAADPSAAAPLDHIGRLLSDSIAHAKQIARGLYPAGLAEHGLAAAVEELVASARQSYAARIEFRAAPDFSLADTDRAAQVYRIVQEALTNALKHSQARRVEVVLSRERGRHGAHGGGPRQWHRPFPGGERQWDGTSHHALPGRKRGGDPQHRGSPSGNTGLLQDPRTRGGAMMSETVSFLVVDDHPVFRQGLVALISSEERYTVCGEAGSADEALSALQTCVPDLALVDISLTGQSGLDLVKTFKAAHPRMLILIISMHDEAVYAARALKAGARGYVMKQEAASVMLEAIRTVLSGKIYVSSANA